MSKFYQFKNETEKSSDLYIYGAITDNKDNDWYASESDVDLSDFKDALDNINDYSTLNMYVNSPGGSVFSASTMASMLQRAKETKHIKVNAYVDGLAASAASFLIMVADEINLYSNSMLMIHKPMSIAWGNANDMQKEIDTLNSIENNVMIPLYEKKAKCDTETIKNLIEAESWLSAKEVDDFFNVNLLNESKEINAFIDTNLFKHYKNVPTDLKKEANLTETVDKLNCQISNGQIKICSDGIYIDNQKIVDSEIIQSENTENTQNVDYSYFENKLNSLREERK